MNIGLAIYKILKDHAGLGALIADRIYPTVAAQKEEYPFVIYTVIEQIPVNRLSGRALMDQIRVEITAYSKKVVDNYSIAIQIRDALDRVAPGTYEGVSIGVVLFESNLGPQWDDETKTFITPVIFRVSYNTGYAV
jgi:hypothetical protein